MKAILAETLRRVNPVTPLTSRGEKPSCFITLEILPGDDWRGEGIAYDGDVETGRARIDRARSS
jgi:hypothetical protein